MIQLLLWYLAAAAAGLLALPVVFRLFRRLPDRGYAFARPAGLLLIGYVFWFLGSLGLLRNDVPSLLFAAALVGGLGAAWLGRAGFAELRAWLGAQRDLVWAVEGLFLAAFALLAVVRAYTPEILGTEKPMEFMFINSILRSPAFPPHDAWLSGHAVSYYYFGYVLIAALARLTATDSAVAFNLGLALLFALAAVAAQGVTLNLIALASRRSSSVGHTSRQRLPNARMGDNLPSPSGGGAGGEGEMTALHRHFLPSLLGPLLLLVAGNFYGLAQLAFVNGWFANTNVWAVRYYYGAGDPANVGASAEANPPLPPEIDYPGLRIGPVNFWDWLDLKQAQEPPPARDGFTWNVGGNWFFAARVVFDRDLMGRTHIEAIDEMPSFSFILGDMHPHVLALPFVILAIGLALEWLLWGRGAPARTDHVPRSQNPRDAGSGTTRDSDDLAFDLAQLAPRLASAASDATPVAPRRSALIRILLTCLFLGALSFLNTWDFPIYLFLLLLALAAGLGLRRGWQAVARDAWRLALFGLALGVVSVLLYYPFYLTFQSQAGGILPNVIWPTRFQQLFVFFGPVMIPVALYLAWLGWRGRRLLDRRAALWAGLGLVGALILLVAALMLAAQASAALGGVVDSFIFPLTRGEALRLAVVHRLVNSLATLFPAVLISLAAGLGVGVLRRAGAAVPAAEPAHAEEAAPVPAAPARPWRQRGAARLAAAPRPVVRAEALLASPAVLMALAMIVTGALLVLGPEWVYLRDNFGYRMNTLFKFYFQAWALWALAGAFGLWHLFQHAREAARWIAGTVASLSVLGSLVYTFTALYSVTGGFAGPPTLDGMAYFRASYPDDWAAIEWLRANVEGAPVVAEAVGGAYRVEESRIAMGTGLPTPMGWSNHEGQWRGSAYSLVAERPAQIQSLYQVRDWATAQAILDQYHIEYVVVGNTERRLYNPVYTPKFDAYMDTVFESGTLTIYRRKPLSSP